MDIPFFEGHTGSVDLIVWKLLRVARCTGQRQAAKFEACRSKIFQQLFWLISFCHVEWKYLFPRPTNRAGQILFTHSKVEDWSRMQKGKSGFEDSLWQDNCLWD